MTLDEILSEIEIDLQHPEYKENTGKGYIFPLGPIYGNLRDSNFKRIEIWSHPTLEFTYGYTRTIWLIPDDKIDRLLDYWDIQEYLIIDFDDLR